MQTAVESFITVIAKKYCSINDFIDTTGITNPDILAMLSRIKQKLTMTPDTTVSVDSISVLKSFGLIKETKAKELILDKHLRPINVILTFSNESTISWDIIRKLDNTTAVSLFGRGNLPFEWIQVVFWFWRKEFVDNILSRFTYNVEYCESISSGSVKLTSDYDITLYGPCAPKVAKEITVFFKTIFGNTTSGFVFDTNIYYSSFIRYHLPQELIHANFYTLHYSCKNKPFYVLNSGSPSDQHIWASMKLILAIEKLGIEDFSFSLLPENKQVLFNHIQDLAKELVSDRKSGNDILECTINLMQTFPMSVSDYTNRLSLVNFKNPETYYTRGAFLHVVVNEQMCSASPLELDQHAYLDSCIENFAEYIQHFSSTSKTAKYKKRLLVGLKQVDNGNNYNNIKDALEKIDDLDTSTKKIQAIKPIIYYFLDMILNNITTDPEDISDNLANCDTRRYGSFANLHF